MQQTQNQLIDLLQWVGGGCLLAQKIILSIAERARAQKKYPVVQRLRITAWVAFCLGLPFIIVLLVLCHNWIAASVQASSAPSMVLGLYLAVRGADTKPPVWLNRLALICIPLGFVYSLYDFGGLNRLTQWLEIGLTIGFLVGTYQLARDRMSGYLWYLLMHVGCGLLMWKQGIIWYALQQAISLVFVADAFITRLRQRSTS